MNRYINLRILVDGISLFSKMKVFLSKKQIRGKIWEKKESQSDIHNEYLITIALTHIMIDVFLLYLRSYLSI